MKGKFFLNFFALLGWFLLKSSLVFAADPCVVSANNFYVGETDKVAIEKMQAQDTQWAWGTPFGIEVFFTKGFDKAKTPVKILQGCGRFDTQGNPSIYRLKGFRNQIGQVGKVKKIIVLLAIIFI